MGKTKKISEMREFLGFTNYYSVYIQNYANIVARFQDKLKVPREIGRKGSKAPISWDEEDDKAFLEIKEKLCSRLGLQRVNPNRPFVLRVDASGYAVGAVLERLEESNRMPTVEDVRARKTVPIAFGQENWH